MEEWSIEEKVSEKDAQDQGEGVVLWLELGSSVAEHIVSGMPLQQCVALLTEMPPLDVWPLLDQWDAPPSTVWHSSLRCPVWLCGPCPDGSLTNLNYTAASSLILPLLSTRCQSVSTVCVALLVRCPDLCFAVCHYVWQVPEYSGDHDFEGESPSEIFRGKSFEEGGCWGMCSHASFWGQ